MAPIGTARGALEPNRCGFGPPWFSACGAGWASGALVALGCVEDELAEQFTGGGVDDADVEVLDQDDDAGSVVGSADADGVEPAAVAPGDLPGLVDLVGADRSVSASLRPGEISALNLEDILRKPTGVLITIRRSKTDPDAQGQLVGVTRGDNRLTDPIRALDAWLEVRPPEPGALFTRVLWRNHPTSERIGPVRSAGPSRNEPTQPASTACVSPATHLAPDTPPRPP